MSEHATAPAEQDSAPTLKITPEFERAVLQRVESGEYESTDDVLSACVDALTVHEDIIHDIQVVELRFARRERTSDSGRQSGRARKPVH